MSKTRAQNRRRQKQKQGQSNRVRWWMVAVALPVLLIALVIYSQRDRSSTTQPEEALPAATLGAHIATQVAAAATESPVPTAPIDPTMTWPLGAADYCRHHPRFARQLGFNERALLTTSAPSIKGLALIQPAEGNTAEQVYQDPSWDDAGYLGHMTFDPEGNVYVFPSPRVSLVDNPPEEQNTLYRVDTDSAQLSPVITLTADAPISEANPYGIMGTTYDCDTQSLYVATVAGSTATAEIGKIVRIELATATVAAELQGIDPFGLSVLNMAGATATETISTTASVDQGAQSPVVKRLYFGAARTAEVYSILLDDQGDFVGQPTLELALPNGALKPWRIVWDSNGDMIVRAMPFDFNLMATSERIEVPFRFRRDTSGLWQFIEE